LILRLFAAGIVILGVACSGQGPDEGKPIAKIGDYVITEKVLRDRMAEWAYYEGVGSLTLENKNNFLNQTIDQEVLIQEAVKLGLHKDASFRRSIEKFWEQTLITALLQKKADTLKDKTIVTSEEIEARYQEIAKTKEAPPPLEELAPSLEEEIREKKKTEALEAWIKELRDKANIQIYEENLKALR